MLYSYSITVPVVATKDDPIEEECILNHGILHFISFHFPAGVHRVTQIQVDYWGWQLYPNNVDEAITSDDFTVQFKEYFPILENPFMLKVRGWNEGGSYPHTIRINFGVLSTKVLGLSSVSVLTEEELKSLVGEYEILGSV